MAVGLSTALPGKGLPDIQPIPGISPSLARFRGATELPLAVGFGVKEKADVDFLKGKADIAVIGSQAIRVLDEQGVSGIGHFIRGLR